MECPIYRQRLNLGCSSAGRQFKRNQKFLNSIGKLYENGKDGSKALYSVLELCYLSVFVNKNPYQIKNKDVDWKTYNKKKGK